MSRGDSSLRREYDWFEIPSASAKAAGSEASSEAAAEAAAEEDGVARGIPEPSEAPTQRKFFEYPGPLHTVVISPAAVTSAIGQTRHFRALPRDRSRRRVEEDLQFEWRIAEGGGTLSSLSDQEVEFHAPSSPGLARLSVVVSQGGARCGAEALITIADRLEVALGQGIATARGLPGYTFERAPGELWRSRLDAQRNLIRKMLNELRPAFDSSALAPESSQFARLMT